jgi:uncharacterized protein (TIGR02271 family)
VIPIVEEVLVIERRLLLKEVVRVRRVRSTERHQESVTLRHHEAVVTRLPVEPPAAGESPEASAEVLRLAEEQLQVGKRMVETGRTRVRRFATEKEVSADVTLHEEHADVLRRAITDPKYIGEIDWADATIEIRETAEQALVSKTARVVEEVALKKIGRDHTETVRDKIRRQQVEIERLGPDGKPLAAPRPRTFEKPADGRRRQFRGGQRLLGGRVSTSSPRDAGPVALATRLGAASQREPQLTRGKQKSALMREIK